MWQRAERTLKVVLGRAAVAKRFLAIGVTGDGILAADRERAGVAAHEIHHNIRFVVRTVVFVVVDQF